MIISSVYATPTALGRIAPTPMGGSVWAMNGRIFPTNGSCILIRSAYSRDRQMVICL